MRDKSNPLPDVRTIEATGKRYKKWMIVGGIFIFAALPIMLVTGSWKFGIVIFVVGFVIAIGANFAAWWHHG